ncbi:MAG: DUF6089 family protein [Paludibacter sp.]
MKKILLFSLLSLLVLPSLNAQRRNGLIGRRSTGDYSIIFSAGPGFLYGDTQGSIFNTSNYSSVHNYDISLGFRQRFKNNFGYKASINFGNQVGDDVGSKMITRGYSFESQIIEASVSAEYMIKFGGGRYRRYRSSEPNIIYGFLGAGVLNSSINHAPITYPGTEFVSKDTAPVIPFGVGYQYKITDDFSLGAEIGWKYVISDLVDGIKPASGTSKSNDVLAGLSVTVSYKL